MSYALLALAFIAARLLWRRRGGAPSWRADIAFFASFTVIVALIAFRLWALAGAAALAALSVYAIERAAKRARDDAWAEHDASIGAEETARREAAALLGVSVDADADEIKEAYRRAIAKAHPDHGGTDGKAARLNAARDRLMSRL